MLSAMAGLLVIFAGWLFSILVGNQMETRGRVEVVVERVARLEAQVISLREDVSRLAEKDK